MRGYEIARAKARGEERLGNVLIAIERLQISKKDITYNLRILLDLLSDPSKIGGEYQPSHKLKLSKFKSVSLDAKVELTARITRRSFFIPSRSSPKVTVVVVEARNRLKAFPSVDAGGERLVIHASQALLAYVHYLGLKKLSEPVSIALKSLSQWTQSKSRKPLSIGIVCKRGESLFNKPGGKFRKILSSIQCSTLRKQGEVSDLSPCSFHWQLLLTCSPT
ncbi:hypothetical protein V6N12_034595 [Hibiscus sabdariffa]|uniref:Uncharacterized protein n=1 Tax=Hibiscus sabdariffa TaxID=183260 RepID=A0ABR2DHL9_9ROSI